MRWEKGDFRNLEWEEMNIDANSKHKNIVVSPTNAGILLTIDKTKSLSTTTTGNIYDLDNWSKSSIFEAWKIK